MKLQPLMTLRATIGETMAVGNGGTGTRMVANVTGGEFEGERLRGSVQASGADWVVIGSDGYGRIDVRIVLSTDDGANVYVTYRGLLEYNEAVNRAFSEGSSTDFGDAVLMTQLRFETGDERYAWLNQTLAIAEGRLHAGSVEYRVYSMHCG